MEARTLSRAVPYDVSPEVMLRALRDQPGLVALFGDWVDGASASGAAGAGGGGAAAGGVDAERVDGDGADADSIDAVIGIRPTRTLDAGEDPFEALGGEPSGTSGTAGGVFGGGWIGYLGYQLSRRLEELPLAPPRAGNLPDHHLARYDHVLLHHARTGRWTCEALPGTDPARVACTLEIVERAIGDRVLDHRMLGGGAGSNGAVRGAGGALEGEGAPSSSDPAASGRRQAFGTRGAEAAVSAGEPGPGVAPRALSSAPAIGAREYRCGPFEATVTGAAHADAVRRALHHIREGDIFQANICRALHAKFHGDPLDLFCAGYERLRPRFAAFLRVPGGAVASLSPELYLRRTGDRVLTSPIKGTAPADSDPRELHASAKNRAENVMIVDLMRNDLSRACVPGSVLSPAVPRVEPHTGVHHLVADVHGTLRPGLDDAALLRSTFPPGSCTGAPKIRATEVINELETTARGVYTGAVGCVSPVAGLAMNVAIRTFEFSGDTVRLGVGGGIVADSDPDGEAFETLVKAAPLLDAVGAHFGAELSREWGEHVAREGGGTTTPGCVLPPADPGPTAVEAAFGTAAPEEVRRLPADASRGVFTTMLVRNGVPEHLERHLARLRASVRECYGMGLPEALRGEVLALAGTLEGPHRLRVTAIPADVSDVSGAQRANADSSAGTTEACDSSPDMHRSTATERERVAEAKCSALAGGSTKRPAVFPPVHTELTSAPLNPTGTVPPDDPWLLIPLTVPGGLGRHKWADRRVLDEAPGPWSPVCDPLLVDADGTVLETGRANLFAVLDGVVVTPPTDGRILPGTMRARVLGLFAEAGYDVVERPIPLAELGRAAEVFVTNALRGARPVGEVRGVGSWSAGPVTRRVQGLLGV